MRRVLYRKLNRRTLAAHACRGAFFFRMIFPCVCVGSSIELIERSSEWAYTFSKRGAALMTRGKRTGIHFAAVISMLMVFVQVFNQPRKRAILRVWPRVVVHYCSPGKCHFIRTLLLTSIFSFIFTFEFFLWSQLISTLY